MIKYCLLLMCRILWMGFLSPFFLSGGADFLQVRRRTSSVREESLRKVRERALSVPEDQIESCHRPEVHHHGDQGQIRSAKVRDGIYVMRVSCTFQCRLGQTKKVFVSRFPRALVLSSLNSRVYFFIFLFLKLKKKYKFSRVFWTFGQC